MGCEKTALKICVHNDVRNVPRCAFSFLFSSLFFFYVIFSRVNFVLNKIVLLRLIAFEQMFMSRNTRTCDLLVPVYVWPILKPIRTCIKNPGETETPFHHRLRINARALLSCAHGRRLIEGPRPTYSGGPDEKL